MCNFFSSFSNSKIFASAKTCRGKSCGTIVWNISAIKTANVNLVYDGKNGGSSRQFHLCLKAG